MPNWEEKPRSYIGHWVHLRMWLTQVRLYTDDKLSPEDVLNKMKEIELEALRMRNTDATSG